MEKIIHYIKKHNLINNGDKIVIAFSGGPDSVYLMLVLLKLRDQMGLSLAAVHINHRLLKEAQEQAEFAQDFCAQHEVPFYCFEKDIHRYAKEEKISVEEAGRKFRYQKFYQVADELGYDSVALAHHRSDLSETVVYRMARGTGWKGMAGIRPRQNRLIRPLLCISKEEILEELKNQKQSYNIDPSNAETVYARNKIRHNVLPELNKVNAQASDHIAELAEQMEELGAYIEGHLSQAWKDCVSVENGICRICRSKLKEYHLFMQKEVLKKALSEVAGSEKNLTRSHVEHLLDLLDAQTGREKDFPYKVWALRQYDELVIQKRQETVSGKIILSGEGDFEIPFASGWMNVKIFPKKEEEFSRKMYTKTFDYDKIMKSVVVRTWKKDDYFVMNQEGQRKKLNRYFIDQKVPKDQREKIPLVADGNHILWIIGGRISGEYKVTEDTKRVLQLTWTQMEE